MPLLVALKISLKILTQLSLGFAQFKRIYFNQIS